MMVRKKRRKRKFRFGCMLKSGEMSKDFMFNGSGLACYRVFYFSALPLIPVEMSVCRRWTMISSKVYPSCPLTTPSTAETIITPSGISPFSSHLIYKHELLTQRQIGTSQSNSTPH